MIDRLLSGAGAVSHIADGLVRTVLRGGSFARQPAGLLLAGLALVAALALAVMGSENNVDRTPRMLEAGAIAATDYGDRLYATVSGGLVSGYVETFVDGDGDGQQGPDETSFAWNYFLVDPESRAGVTVRSMRPPATMYTLQVSGVVVEDPAYVAEDAAYFAGELQGAGLTLDQRHYLDATGDQADGTPFDLGQPTPAAGSTITVDAARSVDFVTVCSTDRNGDGVCSEDEIDLYDVFAYDPVSKRALTVLLDESPEFTTHAITGTLRRAPDEVTDATTTDGASLPDIGISVSPRYLLTDGDAFADPAPFFVGALLAALFAGLVVIGVLAGYLRFRGDGALADAAASMTVGERIPVRVTGDLRAAGALTHVREASADLVRFGLGDAGDSTLILERRGRAEGVALGRGELRSIETGWVSPLRGVRPALRLTGGTGPILVSFDTQADRDRAAAELGAELARPAEPATAEPATAEPEDDA